MKIPFSFRRMFLDPGKTFAVPTVAGARVRVVDGMVWATTSNSPDDVWLGAGDEHTIGEPGLTVIESVARSTVEIIPPCANNARGRAAAEYRFESAVVRAAANLAAVAMTAITLGLLVVLPAKLASSSHETRSLAPSNVVTVSPIKVEGRRPGGIAAAPAVPFSQASSGAPSATRAQ